jgi:formylglycine-generating enzyme required for sulfatase activity
VGSAGALRDGSEGVYPDERPVREVEVEGLWIGRDRVTARDSRHFVEATGYVTATQRPLDPAVYPEADTPAE